MRLQHGSLESTILNVLWTLENKGDYLNSVKTVYNYIKENVEDKKAYTTLKTVMDRLHKKGVLLRFKQKNKFYYRTAFSNKDIVLKQIKQTADTFFNGDIKALIEMVEMSINEAETAILA